MGLKRRGWCLLLLLVATLLPASAPRVAAAGIETDALLKKPAHQAAPTPTPTPSPSPSPAVSTSSVRRADQTVTVTDVAQETAPDGHPMAAGRIIVGFKPGASTSAQTDASRAAGAGTLEPIGASGMLVARVPTGMTTQALAALRARADVAWAEPDYIRRATLIPNDVLFSQQYGPQHIGAPIAWDVTTGSPTVRIAILDCGIFSASSVVKAPDGQTGHPDLRSKIVAEQDFSGSPHGADDFCNHGTLMAGIAAASTSNAIGVAGIGYNSVLLNGKVLGDRGTGTDSAIINGIMWAADNGAKVISMSLGGPGACPISVQQAVDYAWARGAVLVAAAGNGGDDGVGDAGAESPGNCNRVLAIGAVDQNDARPSFSNFGANVDLAAPGSSILSTDFNGTYSTVSGTSPATPHAAGVAALVWSTAFGTSNQAVVDRLTSRADPIAGTTTLWAFGRLNAAAAVGPASCAPRPPVSATSTATGSSLSVTLTATGVGNLIRMLSIGAGSKVPTNAIVSVSGGPSNVSGPLSNILPSIPTATLQLSVRRAAAGQSTMVPLMVTDGCGTWETFVGGGAAAGF